MNSVWNKGLPDVSIHTELLWAYGAKNDGYCLSSSAIARAGPFGAPRIRPPILVPGG